MNLKAERIGGKLLARRRAAVGLTKVGVFGVPNELAGQHLLRLHCALANEIRRIEEWGIAFITLRERTDHWTVGRRELGRHHPADLWTQEKRGLEPVCILYVNIGVIQRIADHDSS